MRLIGPISFLVVSLTLAPLTAQAQPAAKLPRIGFLTPSQDPECEKTPQAEAFRQGLRDRGWVPRQTITVDHRCYETVDQRRVIVNDFVDRRGGVIVAGTAGVEDARSATKTLPIVMLHADPVGVGLVASLAHPGGNITGLSISPPEMTEKRLQLLKEMIPRLSRVAVFADPTVTPRYREELDTAGRTRVSCPPVPVPHTTTSTLPSVALQISSAVVRRWTSGLAGFSNCWRMR